jgi:lipopolysaccharide export system protein LptC
MDAASPQNFTARRGTRIGGLYDRYIAIIKDALPIAALLLLVTIMLLPFISSKEFSFILDKKKVAQAGERFRMESPVYKGTDSKGRTFIITALRSVQKSSADPTVLLEKLRATLETREGLVVLTADEGRFLLRKEQLIVSGEIAIERNDGYRFSSRDVLVDLPSRTAFSGTGIKGTGPLGKFSAGSFRLDLASNAIVFGGGTRLRLEQR